MTQVEQPAVRNRLLAALSPEDFGLLARSLHPISLELKQVLYAPGQTIECVYFPEGGMVSMIAMLEDGAAQEVGLIGREGLVGLPAVLGADSTPLEALVQGAGPALRIRAAELKTAFDHSATLRALLLRYMLALHLQITQTAACNGRHDLEERLARWLLLAHDRAESDRFPMTQEFIAMMLGVRRAGVSVAASILQKAGVIGYKHGCITVLDRSGLEDAACECYGTVQRQFERLLGQPAG
jgi:CRP-like cAMP-binding protein